MALILLHGGVGSGERKQPYRRLRHMTWSEGANEWRKKGEYRAPRRAEQSSPRMLFLYLLSLLFLFSFLPVR